MLKLEFVAETPEGLNAVIKDYVSKLKGTRGGKGSDVEAETGNTPPNPLAPPTGQTAHQFQPQNGQASGFPGQGGGFAPQAGGATTQAAFPAHGAGTLDPTIADAVNKVISRIDGAISSGQPMEACRQWVAGQFAAAGHPDAQNATIDQLKQVFLPRMALPWLQQMYGLMGGK